MLQGPVEQGDVQRRRRRRLRTSVLAGLAMVLVAAPVLFVVAAVAQATWAFLGGLAMVAAGLLTVGHPLRRDHNTHGTKIWQNDGQPGGGAAGGM
jgi:uncharacterized membrane protein HdeD (DUF308 family)